MRLSTLFLFVFWIGILGINCQELVDKEDKDGGSGVISIVGDEVDNDDEDGMPTASGEEIDIDETTIPSDTNVQSEEPTTREEKETPTTETEEVTTVTEKVSVVKENPTTEDDYSGETATESDTTDGDVEGSTTGDTEIKSTTASNEIPKDNTTPYPDLPDTTPNSNDVDDMFGDPENPENLDESNVSNMEARTDENGDDEISLGLTTEVVVAVIVGAVCAIIIIAFLVYRLKKRDEGSYALDESTHYTNKDAYKFSAEGKEAFV